MLIVTGTVTSTEEHFERVRAASLDHVRASRAEPGCVSHAVAADCEDPLTLVFFERWADRAALEAHYAAPSAARFVGILRELRLRTTGPTVDEIAAPLAP